VKTRHPALGGPIAEGARRLMEELGLNTFTAVLAVNSGQAVYEVMTSGPVWSLVASCIIVSGVPAIVAWLVGRRVLHLNPALLMGAIAGARQNTACFAPHRKRPPPRFRASAIRCPAPITACSPASGSTT